MKSNAITSTLGILMTAVCAIVGFLDGIVLGGFGICGGFPLTWDVFAFAAFTALLPAGTVGLLCAPWWIPVLFYSGPLVFSLLGGAISGEWYRSLASFVCLALAFGGAWLFRPRLNQGRR